MYNEKRPSIPKDIERQIKTEAGHCCSITNCDEHTYLEIHHINEDRNDNRVENLILLCDKHHKMAHRGIIDKKSQIIYKNLLKQNISLNNGIFVRSIEGDRIKKFLDKIRELLIEHSNEEPSYISQDAGYFFPREIYYKIVSFL